MTKKHKDREAERDTERPKERTTWREARDRETRRHIAINTKIQRD